jgi:hypothetical protein
MSGCLGDQVVNLRISQVVGDPVVRINGDVDSRMRTVIEMLDIPLVIDETHPTEVVMAISTYKVR